MARTKELYHYGIPEKGKMIVLFFYLETYDKWTVRLCRSSEQVQRIIEGAKDTAHPCRWQEAPLFVTQEPTKQ